MSPSPTSPIKARLYGRNGCHLCEQMARLLRAFGIPFEEVDVDTEESLRARYGDRVPVLTDAAGKELCFGRLDPAVLHLIQ